MSKPIVETIYAADFFAGIKSGGRGLDALGIESPIICEIGKVERKTIRLNTDYNISQFPSDIRNYTPARKDVDLVTFGIFTPPCQNFTTMNVKRDNEKGYEYIFETMRVIKELQPEHLIIENVRGFKSATVKGKKIHVILEKFLISEGYNLLHDTRNIKNQYIFSAANYGIPQNRVRYILVASKSIKPVIPKIQPKINFGDILDYVNRNGDTSDVKHSDLMKSRFTKLKEGSWQKLDPSKTYKTAYLLPANGKGQAPTILNQDKTWIVWKNRVLSIAEIKALQSLPENHKLAGTKKDKQRGLGNVFPAYLMYQFAEQFANPSHVKPWNEYVIENELKDINLEEWF